MYYVALTTAGAGCCAGAGCAAPGAGTSSSSSSSGSNLSISCLNCGRTNRSVDEAKITNSGDIFDDLPRDID